MSAPFTPWGFVDPDLIPQISAATPPACGGSRVPRACGTDPAFSTFESATGASDAFGTGLEAPEFADHRSGEPPFQAKASEDNGSTAKGHEAGNAVTGDASRQSAGCDSGASFPRMYPLSAAAHPPGDHGGPFPAAGGPVAAGEEVLCWIDNEAIVIRFRLSANVAFLLKLLCAHDRIDESEVIARSLAAYAEKIGVPAPAPPLELPGIPADFERADVRRGGGSK